MNTNSEIVKGEELYLIFQETNWEELYGRLEAYIIYVLRYKYGVIKNNDDILLQTHEIISDVMNLIFISGTRNWNKETCPSFNSFIFGVTKSHINNLFSTTKINETQSLEEVQHEVDGKHFEDPKGLNNTDLRDEAFSQLKDLGADDDELLVFECMADGIVKPEKIRAELGLKPSELNNILRRLNRKTNKIKNKIRNI